MALERPGSEGLLKAHVSSFSPSGAIRLGPLALARLPFLLDPGGPGYVGNNSYNNTSRLGE